MSSHSKLDEAEDSGLEAVDSADESAPLQQNRAFREIPLDATGCVKGDLVFEMSRCSLMEPSPQRGLMFAFQDVDGVHRTLFARSEAWIAKAAREEVVFHRGLGTPGKHDASVVGGIDFHHWLVDQSRSINVRHNLGDDSPVRLCRQGLTRNHSFDFRGQTYTWQRTGNSLEGQNESRLLKMNLKCMDESGKMLAFYTKTKSGFRRCCDSNKQVGHFQICSKGLDSGFVELLLMTFTAVYVKLQKRILQGSQAGWGGGTGAAVMYAIGG